VRSVPGGTLRTRPVQWPFWSLVRVVVMGLAMSPALTATRMALTARGAAATRASMEPCCGGVEVLPAPQPAAVRARAARRAVT